MKVLLIDDHPLILSAMHSVLTGLDATVEAVGVESAGECRALLRERADFDLVLLDLQLGDASGFDLLAELRQLYPALPVVVVSASDRPGDVIRAIDAGAMGFVPKRASNELLFEALHRVMAGGIYLPPMLDEVGASRSAALRPSMRLGRMAAGQAEPGPAGLRAREGASLDTPRAREPRAAVAAMEALGLTPRQREVLALLLQGKSNKMIARDLAISVETVKDHVAAVLRTLGVNSRTQAVLAIGHRVAGGDEEVRPGLSTGGSAYLAGAGSLSRSPYRSPY